MTTIAIVPENPAAPTQGYYAVAGSIHSVGKTAGQALDALASQLTEDEKGTMVVVQLLRPDHFFTSAQQQRLEVLMSRWRAARDAGKSISPQDQAELESLRDTELRAAAQRARALIEGLAN